MIIALTGFKHSGKSEVARELVRRGYVRIGFADPLKDMLRRLGLSDDHLYGHLKEEPCAELDGQTPRWAMQSLGTEWGRKCMGDRFWLNRWRDKAAGNGLSVVVDDCRFLNEAELVRACGGEVWRVTRPSELHPDPNAHASELEQLQIVVERTIDNRYATVEELHAAV